MSEYGEQGKDDRKQQKIIFPSNGNITLHKCENSWKPLDISDMLEPNPETVGLCKKVSAILNKLTSLKFKMLVKELKNLDVNTEEKLKAVLDLIFEKAIEEQIFIVAYANMCKQIAMIEMPLVGQPRQYLNFHKLLINKCRKEFEQGRNGKPKDEEREEVFKTAGPSKRKLLSEIEEEEGLRFRQIGIIRFICELFKLKMLTEFFVHHCVRKLLARADEESLECVYMLLKIIGKDLCEGKSNKPDASGVSMMDLYFNIMQKNVDTSITSPRVWCLLQDIKDLRQNNWVPRQNKSNSKAINQVHNEAERETHKRQKLDSTASPTEVAQKELTSEEIYAQLEKRLELSKETEDQRDKIDFLPSPANEGQEGLTNDEIEVQLKKVLESSQEIEDIFEWIDETFFSKKVQESCGETEDRSESIDEVDFLASPSKVGKKEFAYKEIGVQLKKVLKSSKEIEDIFEWIDTNVPERTVNKPCFTHALLTAVVEDAVESKCKIKQAVLKKRLPILARYIGKKKFADIQALCVIRHLITRLDHTKNVLEQIFDTLNDRAMITEDILK